MSSPNLAPLAPRRLLAIVCAAILLIAVVTVSSVLLFVSVMTWWHAIVCLGLLALAWRCLCLLCGTEWRPVASL